MADDLNKTKSSVKMPLKIFMKNLTVDENFRNSYCLMININK